MLPRWLTKMNCREKEHACYIKLSNGRLLPKSELEALRNVARSNENDTIIAGGI
jgi:hypothetical protein